MKNAYKFLTIIVISFFLISPLTSCNNNSSKIETNSKIAKPKIALVISTLKNPFFTTLRDAAVKKAIILGYELIVKDSENDVEKEKANINSLLDQNIGVLILNPTDSDTVGASVIEANKRQIPVITVDRQANNGLVECHISSDNIKGGQLAAAFILETLKGKGSIIELQGIIGASATKDRGRGFHLGIAGKENITLIASYTAAFDFEKGFSVMKKLLNTKLAFDAVFAHNDQMALGALKALKTANRKVLIVGFDGTPDAVSAVKNGDIGATIAQQPDLMGSIAIETALKVLKGESIEKQIAIDLKLIKK